MIIQGFDLKEEFEKALRGLKANKASEIDLIVAEFLQNLEQADKLFCDLYETGDIPNDYKVKKTVTVRKKQGQTNPRTTVLIA